MQTSSQEQVWKGIAKGATAIAAWELRGVPLGLLLDALAHTALAESSMRADAVGDNGQSVGPMQFYQPTFEALSPDVPWPGDWRSEPEAAGWASVLYAAQAIKADPSWLAQLTNPSRPRRLAAWRVLWRYNPYANGGRIREARISAEQRALSPRRMALAADLARQAANRFNREQDGV